MKPRTNNGRGTATIWDLESLSFPDAPRIKTPPPGPVSGRLLQMQDRRGSNARTYPRGWPVALDKARGATVTDADGNTYIDCLSGAGSMNAGHNVPPIKRAIQAYINSDGVASSLDFPTAAKDRFTEVLFEILPPALRAHARIQFCSPSGADAVEAAVKLVRTATRRTTIISFQGSYHGMTLGALGLTGWNAPKEGLGAVPAGGQFSPYAYCLRCPFKLTLPACGQACAHAFGAILEDPHSGVTTPAGVILEPIQGEGGTIVPPDGWLRRIARYAYQHDVPLIVDEIQCGMGRTGRWWAFEHEDVLPDVMLISKSVGGGLPLAVMVYHERLDLWRPGAHVGTFRGNQLALVAGAAAIEFIRSHDLIGHAARLGEQLLRGLRYALASSPHVRDVRGRGLMVGIETPSGDIAHRVRDDCLARGLIVELGGRDDRVVRLLPPLVLTEGQAAKIVAILSGAFEDLEAVDPTSQEDHD